MPAPERSRPHEANGASEESLSRRLRDVLENISEAYLLLDPEGNVLDLNRRAASHLGLDPQGAIGRSMLQVRHGAMADRFREAFELALRTGETQLVSGPSVVLPGRWMEVRLHRVAEGVAVHFLDVTERREVEAALRRSEQELKEFFELAAVGNAQMDLVTGRYRRVSRRFCEISGYAAEELQDLTPEDITHPDDFGLERALSDRLLAGEIPSFELEKRLIRKDGSTVWVQISVTLSRDGDGRPRHALRVLQDVSTRRRAEGALRASEKKLRAVLDVLPIGVFIADADGRILATNPAAAALWGGAPHSEGPERYCADYPAWWPGTGLPVQAHERGMTRAVRRGEICLGEELEIQSSTGERRTILSYALPIRDEHGRIAGAVGANVDITARKEAERRLRELTERLEQLVAERTAVAEERARQLQTMSLQLTQAEEQERHRLARLLHDGLQQLLVGAKLGLGMLRSRAADRPDLQEQAGRVDRLLQECIESSRSLSYELSPPILYEGGLGDSLRWLTRHVQEKYGLEVELILACEPPRLAVPVRVFIFQALRELLFNVRKHAATDRATVEVVCEEHESRIAVSDGGAGFDPAALATPHAGFGLFSIRERVAVLGGRLEIRSAPGAGSRFTLVVPAMAPLERRRPAPEETAPAEAVGPPRAAPEPRRAVPPAAASRRARGRTSRPAAAGDGARGGAKQDRIRVLLADDHRIMRQGLETLLEEEPDLEVVGGASDGHEAVEMARRLRPDVILMDVTMPEMDGVEATRRIVAEHPDIRIIGLSMHEERDMGARMREAGAAAYLHKAGPPQWLLGAIRAG